MEDQKGKLQDPEAAKEKVNEVIDDAVKQAGKDASIISPLKENLSKEDGEAISVEISARIHKNGSLSWKLNPDLKMSSYLLSVLSVAIQSAIKISIIGKPVEKKKSSLIKMPWNRR